MINFLKKILYFLKKSYPKPIIIIIGLLLLISFIVGYKITVEQKAGVEQKVFEREQEIITKYNKLVEIEKNQRELEEREKYKKSSFGYEWFEPTGLDLESELRRDSEFNKLKVIRDTPFYKLWLENLINHNSFILAILAILVLPIIRVLFLFGLYIKKQFQEIRCMPMFQKYLIGLLFGVLIVLILILLKIF